MIKQFRFIRSFFFAFRILILYVLLFAIKRVISETLYQKLLFKVNCFVAKRGKRYIFRLRGIFIKLGQFLGMTSKLFWPEIGREFEDMQDKVPPVPYAVIEKRFFREFNVSPKMLFAHFDEKPVASASLGQVHFAITKDQKKVAVKSLYPGMENLVKQDLKSIKAILKLTSLVFPHLDYDMIFNEFSEMVLVEIDYVQEKKNLEEIKNNFAQEKDFLFPLVLDEYSSNTVLTTEYIDGIKINHVEEMERQGIDTKKVAQLLVKAYYKMFFIDQKFHSDPHPGNIFVVREENHIQIAFIDFGSVEIFTERFHRNIPKIVTAIINKQIPKILDSFNEMGFISRIADRDQIESLIAYRFDKLENLKITDYRKLNFKDFNDFDALKKLDLKLSEIMRSFQIPRNYMYFARTVSLLSSLAAELDPKVNIFQMIWPYLEQFVIGKNKTIADFLKKDLRHWITDISTIPEYSVKALEIVNQGKFKITIKDLNKNTKILYLLGHQFIYTLLLITFGTFALVLYINHEYSYSQYFVYLSAIFAFFLVISLFRHRKLKDY